MKPTSPDLPINVIKLSDFLAKKVHENLVNWYREMHWQNYLAGGIHQFYPSYINFSKYHMYVRSEQGATIVIPIGDNSKYWEGVKKLRDELNRGACV